MWERLSIVNHRLHLSETTSEATRHSILAPLRAYNISQTGPYANRGLAIEIRDADERTLGGLWGWTSYDWLFVQLLVVPETMRGQGAGQELMALAEAEARRRGCIGAWLDTFDFQARPFYEKLGYTVFGQIEDHPKDHARFFLQKRFR